MTWTDERVEQLKKLWSQGYSASQIAKDLGGTTRNAVIGKIHRLNLVARQSPKNTPPLLTSAATGFAAAAGVAASSAMAKSKAIAAKLPTTKASDYMAPSQNWAAGYADPGAYKASPYAGAFNTAAAENPFGANSYAGNAGKNSGGAHNPFKNGRASCQWPVGDPRQQGFHFCGAAAQDGCSYCGEHMKMAYQPVQRKRLGLGNTDLHTTGTPDEREIIVTF